ncbi:MAG: DUF411 domain-containing protein [Cellvibrionaceae bacterium]
MAISFKLRLLVSAVITTSLLALITFSQNSKAESSLEKLRNQLRPMDIYKSPSCGCCDAWVDHLSEAGLRTRIHHPKNLDKVKRQLGISPQYQACHTGVKSGFFFEGHIPAEVVQHFLLHKPVNAIGLAVPDMPMGSPGMDVDGSYSPYDVLQINKNGSSSIYARVSIEGIIYSKANDK